MLKGALTVGLWTAASRVAGFARDILIAALLGAGPIADAFFVANRLPNLFRRLFGEGAFNAAFVPVFSGLLTTEGEDVARGFAEEAAAALAFWLLVLTLVGELFMPQLLHVIAAGFARDPAKFALTVTLSRITFPYLLLICLAALLSGVLNALNRFVAAAAAPLLYNAFSIAAMLALAHVLPTAGHALAWGVSASGVAQLALLYWAVWRGGMTLHLPRPRMTPRMRLLLRRMAPGLIGAGITQLNLAMDVFHRQPAAGRFRFAALLRRSRQSITAGRARHRGGHRAAAAAEPPGQRRRHRRGDRIRRTVRSSMRWC